MLATRGVAGSFPQAFSSARPWSASGRATSSASSPPCVAQEGRGRGVVRLPALRQRGLTVQVRASGADVVDAVDFVNAVWDEVD